MKHRKSSSLATDRETAKKETKRGFKSFSSEESSLFRFLGIILIGFTVITACETYPHPWWEKGKNQDCNFSSYFYNYHKELMV